MTTIIRSFDETEPATVEKAVWVHVQQDGNDLGIDVAILYIILVRMAKMNDDNFDDGKEAPVHWAGSSAQASDLQ